MTTGATTSRPGRPATDEPRRPILTAAAAVATPIVLVALAILPFLSPPWFYAAQARTGADAWTGWPIETVNEVTGGIMADLVFGPPDFDQVVDGVPVLGETERGHMRDVRNVATGFAAVALVAAAVLAVALIAGRGGTRAWRGVGLGAKVLGVGVVAVGVFSVVAFDAAFELFHRLLFPGGDYTFDPATQRLVQLFPEALWYQTAIAVGALILALSVAAGLLAAWRIRAIGSARGAPAADVASERASDPSLPEVPTAEAPTTVASGPAAGSTAAGDAP